MPRFFAAAAPCMLRLCRMPRHQLLRRFQERRCARCQPLCAASHACFVYAAAAAMLICAPRCFAAVTPLPPAPPHCLADIDFRYAFRAIMISRHAAFAAAFVGCQASASPATPCCRQRAARVSCLFRHAFRHVATAYDAEIDAAFFQARG